jgi:hypothetical protein
MNAINFLNKYVGKWLNIFTRVNNNSNKKIIVTLIEGNNLLNMDFDKELRSRGLEHKASIFRGLHLYGNERRIASVHSPFCIGSDSRQDNFLITVKSKRARCWIVQTLAHCSRILLGLDLPKKEGNNCIVACHTAASVQEGFHQSPRVASTFFKRIITLDAPNISSSVHSWTMIAPKRTMIWCIQLAWALDRSGALRMD